MKNLSGDPVKFNLNSGFVFRSGSFDLIEFQKELLARKIPYVSRESTSPYSLVADIYFYVPHSYLPDSTRIYEKIRLDSLVHSKLNLLREIKDTDSDDASVPGSVIYKQKKGTFIHYAILSFLILITFSLFYLDRPFIWIVPALALLTYFLFKTFLIKTTFVIYMNDTEIVFNDRSYAWNEIIYLDKIDESLTFNRFMIHIITAGNTEYKINPALFGTSAEDFISKVKTYIYRSKKSKQ